MDPTTEVGSLEITNIEGLTSHVSSGYIGAWARIEKEDNSTLRIHPLRDGYVHEIVGFFEAGIGADSGSSDIRDQIYDHSSSIITEGTGIDIVSNDSDSTITISVTNEFTQAHETKLDGIADGAEVNVQSDWDEVDTTSDAFIENKPNLFSGDYDDLTNTPSIPGEDDIYEYTANFITDGTGITIDENYSDNTITISVTNEFTDAHETKLDGIADGAEVNVKSDWDEVDTTSDAFIQNKPVLFSGSYNDLTDTPSMPDAVTGNDIYNFNLDIITDGTGIDLITNDSDNTITISVTNEFTSVHETKLDGIDDGAEVNVQSDWTETDTNSDAFIQNKPTITDPVQSDWTEADSTQLSYIQNKPPLFSGSYDDLTDKPNIADSLTEDDIYNYNVNIISDGTGIDLVTNDSDNTITISVSNEFTADEKSKLAGISDRAEMNVQSDWTDNDLSSDAYIHNKPTITDPVQSDWTEVDSTQLSYIQNKPTLFSGDYGDLSNRPTLFSGSYNDLTDTPDLAGEITEDDIWAQYQYNNRGNWYRPGYKRF